MSVPIVGRRLHEAFDLALREILARVRYSV
jgi:hypothetical protein